MGDPLSNYKIAAHFLVKDEEDVIKECIDHVSQYCDYIFVIDNGSNDKTYEICKNHPGVNWCERIVCTYSDALRQPLIEISKKYLKSGHDWFLALSADHFFTSDPRSDIQRAIQENANVITYDVAQFYITDQDLKTITTSGQDWSRRPVEERLKYYTINYFNFPVAFQFDENIKYVQDVTEWPRVSEKRIASFSPVLKHYQFRTIDQVKMRLEIRKQQITNGFKGFRHYRSFDWNDYIFDHRMLHYFSGAWEREKKPTLDDLLNYKPPFMTQVKQKIKKIVLGR